MLYPALDVVTDHLDTILVLIDDCRPTAVEGGDDGDSRLTIFFADVSSRDRAADVITRALPNLAVERREVDDGDWARRSQHDLTPITVDRVVVAPPWCAPLPVPASESSEPLRPRAAADQPVVVVIQPSMGFGTGHHASTRLCLRALQSVALEGAALLDVGTGSGVLAIAARLLGARQSIGIDCDPDAIRSANENVQLNPGADGVSFEVADLTDWLRRADSTAGMRPTPADVVTANLTAALLERAADVLTAAVRPGGVLILSGLFVSERAAVLAAFADMQLVQVLDEDGWAELTLTRA